MSFRVSFTAEDSEGERRVVRAESQSWERCATCRHDTSIYCLRVSKIDGKYYRGAGCNISSQTSKILEWRRECTEEEEKEVSSTSLFIKFRRQVLLFFVLDGV